MPARSPELVRPARCRSRSTYRPRRASNRRNSAWLGVTPYRHSALGDDDYDREVFRACAEIAMRDGAFLEAAPYRCGRPLTGNIARAGSPPRPQSAWPAPGLDRIDSYPYRRRIRGVMSAPPRTLRRPGSRQAQARLIRTAALSSLCARRMCLNHGKLPAALRRPLRERCRDRGEGASDSSNSRSRPLAIRRTHSFIARSSCWNSQIRLSLFRTSRASWSRRLPIWAAGDRYHRRIRRRADTVPELGTAWAASACLR